MKRATRPARVDPATEKYTGASLAEVGFVPSGARGVRRADGCCCIPSIDVDEVGSASRYPARCGPGIRGEGGGLSELGEDVLLSTHLRTAGEDAIPDERVMMLRPRRHGPAHLETSGGAGNAGATARRS